MPRAFPNSPHSQRLKKDETFRALVSRACTEKKVKRYQIANAMQVTPQTLINRMKNPDGMTLAELRRARDFLGWSAEELDAII